MTKRRTSSTHVPRTDPSQRNASSTNGSSRTHASLSEAPSTSEGDQQSMERFLVISEDHDTRAGFVQHFMHNGTAISTAEHADTALTLLELSGGYDLIVVDTAGHSDGLDLLRQLRSAGAGDAQILMIVSQAHPEDGLYCIQAGADDFVTKPFVMDELVVRMKALLQRATTSSDACHRGHTVQGLTLDYETRTCYREGKHVDLTTREFDLLHHLFKRRGRTVSREGLVEGVWGRPHAISPRTVDRHVTAIRRKIEADPSAPIYLQTIYGEGYRFMPTE